MLIHSLDKLSLGAMQVQNMTLLFQAYLPTKDYLGGLSKEKAKTNYHPCEGMGKGHM
jgi:hypothetical protein